MLEFDHRYIAGKTCYINALMVPCHVMGIASVLSCVIWRPASKWWVGVTSLTLDKLQKIKLQPIKSELDAPAMYRGQNAEMISKKSMGRSLPQCLHCKTRSLSQNIWIQTAEAHYNKKIKHKYIFFLSKWKSSSSWNTGVCVIVNWCVSSITVDHLIIAKQFPSPESVDLSIPQDIFRQIHLTLFDKYS